MDDVNLMNYKRPFANADVTEEAPSMWKRILVNKINMCSKETEFNDKN